MNISFSLLALVASSLARGSDGQNQYRAALCDLFQAWGGETDQVRKLRPQSDDALGIRTVSRPDQSARWAAYERRGRGHRVHNWRGSSVRRAFRRWGMLHTSPHPSHRR